MKVTFELTPELIAAVEEALETRKGKIAEEVVFQAFKLGIRQLNYRTERNKEQYAMFKEYRATLTK